MATTYTTMLSPAISVGARSSKPAVSGEPPMIASGIAGLYDRTERIVVTSLTPFPTGGGSGPPSPTTGQLFPTGNE